MEVTDVETFAVDADWRNWFFVQVKTDEGITGVGEALGAEQRETVRELSKRVSELPGQTTRE